jgi:hypothetical protein
MKKENLLKTSTHTHIQKRHYQKYDEGGKEREEKKKLMKRKTQGEMRYFARVLVFIPRAGNSSRKLRAYKDVPGK